MPFRWMAALCVGFLAGCSSVPHGTPQDPPPPARVNGDLEEYVRIAAQLMQEEPEPPRGFPLSSAVWPMAELKVGWENPEPANETQRGWVKEAVLATWCSHGRIQLTGWGPADESTNIRIRIEDSKRGAYTNGLGRQLDMKQPGMVLPFTFTKWRAFREGFTANPAMTAERFQITTVAIHEFGHALGIAHEHNREDATGDPKVCAQGGKGDILVGKYDMESCMNYRNAKSGNHGKLSAGDIATIRFMYPATPPETKAEGRFAGRAAMRDQDRIAGLGIELDLAQDHMKVTGTVIMAYQHTTLGNQPVSVLRRQGMKIEGWKVSNMMVLHARGNPIVLNGEDLAGETEVRSISKTADVRKIDGQVVEKAAVFDRKLFEYEFEKYLPKKIVCTFSDDGKSLTVDAPAAGLAFSFAAGRP